MAKPLTEHTAKLRTGKGERAHRGPEPLTYHEHSMEPVEGGRVRRIVFEGDEPEAAPEPVRRHAERDPHAWQPRHSASMDDIEFEVDHLDRFRSRRKATAAPDAPVETGTLYESDRGAVREARQQTDRGERRVLYTSKREGDRFEERRFSGRMVDEVLSKRAAPVEEEVVREETVEYVPRTRRVVEEVVVEPKRAKKAKAAKPAKAKKSKAPKAVAPVAPESEYQPQCAAVTKGGVQCRNSAKDGSRLCGSHQGYKPVSAHDLADTTPVVTGAADTLPGQGREKASGGKQAQCGAYTSTGMQCRNSSRKNSKYCGAHKGYRAPSKAQLESRLDTKPRWDKAPDTLPDVK